MSTKFRFFHPRRPATCPELQYVVCRWSALYPLMSMVNHSCCPNSEYCYVQDAAILRAGQDLSAGQASWFLYLRHAWEFNDKVTAVCRLSTDLAARVGEKLYSSRGTVIRSLLQILSHLCILYIATDQTQVLLPQHLKLHVTMYSHLL